MLILEFEGAFEQLLLFICNFIDYQQFLLKYSKQNKKNTRSATTNFGKEEVLKIIFMITITFWTSGDVDPVKFNIVGSRNPIFDIPGSQTCQFVS